MATAQHSHDVTFPQKASNNRSLPTHITCDGKGYRVLVVRQNKPVVSAFFSWRIHGTKAAALQAAVEYRDRHMRKLGLKVSPFGEPVAQCRSNKRSWSHPGVSFFTGKARRARGYVEEFVFGVRFYGQDGRPRTKNFVVGRRDQVSNAEIRHARKTANAFRDEAIWHHRQGLLFDETRYRSWRNKTLYPFVPPDDKTHG